MPKISALPPMTSADADDEAPIVDDSASSTKKFTLTVLKEWLQSLSGWISGAMIAAAAITKAKVDFTTSGGIWWEELGRTTLGATGTSISVSGITGRKHLLVLLDARPTGGTLNVGLRFNNDSGNNYAGRGSNNGGADSSGGSQAQFFTKTAVDANPQQTIFEILNVAALEKVAYHRSVIRGTAGAANVPDRKEDASKWANTADLITRVDALDIGGTGDLGAGSSLIVLGHD